MLFVQWAVKDILGGKKTFSIKLNKSFEIPLKKN